MFAHLFRFLEKPFSRHLPPLQRRTLLLLPVVLATVFSDELIAGSSVFIDQSFNCARFTARCYPRLCFSDGRGGVLWTLALPGAYPNDLAGANGLRTGGLVRTFPDGSVDPNFVVGPNLQETVGVAVQADGKILVGARSVGDDAPNGTPNYRIFRVLTNGVIDAGYHSPVFGAAPRYLTVQADQKVLVVGDGVYQKTPTNNGLVGIVRLQPDGTLDQTFQTPSIASATLGVAVSINANPALDALGRIYLAGGFRQANGETRQGIARFDQNGTLDPNFLPTGFDFNQFIGGLLLQSSGKVLIAGRLTLVTNSVPSRESFALMRLNLDGSVDYSFNLVSRTSIAFNRGRGIAETPDGKLLTINTSLARFDADGTLDDTFTRHSFQDVNGAPLGMLAFEQLSNGDILIPTDPAYGYGAVTVGGQVADGVVCMHDDGTLSSAFGAPRFEREAFPTIVKPEPDGTVLVAGNFDRVGLTARAAVARLTSNGDVDPAYSLSLANLASASAVLPTATNRTYALLQAGHGFWDLQSKLVRLQSDGQTDPDFVPGLDLNANYSEFLPGIALQSAQVLIACGAGPQLVVDGANVPFVRLLDDGSPDTNFLPSIPMIGAVRRPDGSISTNGVLSFWEIDKILLGDLQVLCVAPDGKILLALGRTPSGDAYSYRLIRLNGDGGTDSSFSPCDISPAQTLLNNPTVTAPDGSGQVSEVFPKRCINKAIVQANGGIIICGTFTNLNGIYRPAIARLKPDSTLDQAFPAGNGPATVESLTPITISDVSEDLSGGLWITGNFVSWDGLAAPGYVRLNSDGTVNTNSELPVSHVPLDDFNLSAFSGAGSKGSGVSYVCGPHLVAGNVWPRAISRLISYPPALYPVGTNPLLILGFRSEPGQSYWLQTSLDLKNWSNDRSLEGTGDQMLLEMTVSPGPGQRFFRLIYR